MIEGSSRAGGKADLRFGMVGGGPGAFIGDVHRKAAVFDGNAVIAAGCFSSDHAKTLETGRSLGLPEDRLYASWAEMARSEGGRSDRIDWVSIVTPNNTHYAIAKAFLQQGFHVLCDKPLTVEAAEARELDRLARDKGLLFCVTYAYTGYPMVKHARAMIRAGDIGEVRFVNAEYPQDWLATPEEKTGQKQAAWRTDPKLTGKSNCIGDIGTHVENIVSYLTGLRITRVSARLDIMLAGRVLDDNASVMVEYDKGAKGLYWTSQIAWGYDNALRVRVFGTQGSIQWSQENPNYLRVSRQGKPTEILSRGRDSLAPRAAAVSRIPAGHPEGYYEAFANIYAAFEGAVALKKRGKVLSADDLDFPDAQSGLEGVRFIGACVESSHKDSAWVALEA
jgi:predicted dehydrogenase